MAELRQPLHEGPAFGNFAFDATDTFKLRLNYDKALGRANYDQLATGQGNQHGHIGDQHLVGQSIP